MNEELDTLPANEEMERTVLGSILLEGYRISEAIEFLTEDDFSLDSHRRIFRRMAAMTADGQPIDVITLAEAMQASKELTAVGGYAYLTSLTEGIYRNVQTAEYMRVLRDKTILRRTIVTCSGAIARCSDQSEPATTILAELSSQLSGLVDERVGRGQVYSSADMAEEAEARLLSQKEDASVIPFGIARLDEFCGGGMRLGELWVIGAPPSRGKTTLTRQIVSSAVYHNIPAYVHSGEMTRESWFDITACILEGMPAWKVRDPYLMNLSERERLRSAVRKLAKLPFFISDAGGIELDRLIFNAGRQKEKNSIQLFAVDYAQIIKAPGRDKREQISNVANRLREFAKENNVATILLSQMARPEGRNINTRPNMFGLKESGALEESAHGVLLPYLPVDAERHTFTGEDEIVVGKQRFGPVGSVPLHFDGEYLLFRERSL